MHRRPPTPANPLDKPMAASAERPEKGKTAFGAQWPPSPQRSAPSAHALSSGNISPVALPSAVGSSSRAADGSSDHNNKATASLRGIRQLQRSALRSWTYHLFWDLPFVTSCLSVKWRYHCHVAYARAASLTPPTDPAQPPVSDIRSDAAAAAGGPGGGIGGNQQSRDDDVPRGKASGVECTLPKEAHDTLACGRWCGVCLEVCLCHPCNIGAQLRSAAVGNSDSDAGDDEFPAMPTAAPLLQPPPPPNRPAPTSSSARGAADGGGEGGGSSDAGGSTSSDDDDDDNDDDDDSQNANGRAGLATQRAPPPPFDVVPCIATVILDVMCPVSGTCLFAHVIRNATALRCGVKGYLARSAMPMIDQLEAFRAAQLKEEASRQDSEGGQPAGGISGILAKIRGNPNRSRYDYDDDGADRFDGGRSPKHAGNKTSEVVTAAADAIRQVAGSLGAVTKEAAKATVAVVDGGLLPFLCPCLSLVQTHLELEHHQVRVRRFLTVDSLQLVRATAGQFANVVQRESGLSGPR